MHYGLLATMHFPDRQTACRSAGSGGPTHGELQAGFGKGKGRHNAALRSTRLLKATTVPPPQDSQQPVP